MIRIRLGLFIQVFFAQDYLKIKTEKMLNEFWYLNKFEDENLIQPERELKFLEYLLGNGKVWRI